MPIDTELEKLIINKNLTKEQFEQAIADGSISDNDLSFVDDIIDTEMSDTSENVVQNKVIKAYIDTTEQEIIENFMSSDSDLQTQITGLSTALTTTQSDVITINSKIPASASSSDLLVTNTELTNATQDVRYDFAEADSELQTQINEQVTAITGKAEIDLSNVSENIDYVVETYTDEDGNWYRVYKSGWIEQGGAVSGTSSVTVTFLKPFADTNYKITSAITNATSNDSYMAAMMMASKTTTGFTANLNSVIKGKDWVAYGKGA